MERITEVAAALIWQGDRFLICQRPAHKARGLLWEFVGGKQEPGETLAQTLIRECREELDVTVSVGPVFCRVLHVYPDITIRLTLFNAALESGEMRLLEHNAAAWITPEEIDNYDFCPADEEILARLRTLAKGSITMQNEKKLTLRVATFNIRKGLDVGYDMTLLAELVRQVDPDIIGLQEVEILSDRVEGRDLLQELAQAAGYPYFRYIRAMDCHGGYFGSAMMSRLPILDFEITPLVVKEGDEPRAVGHAVLHAAGERIDFFCTHFSYKYPEFIDLQAIQLHELSREYPCRILVGDFNTPNLPGVLSALKGTRLVNGGQYLTFTTEPKSIDDIVADDGWQITDRGMVEHGGRSDHNLLWAELTREM